MVLSVGEPGPWFSAPTPGAPNFDFETMGGRYVLLAFLPAQGAARELILHAVMANRALFDDRKLSAFVVVPDRPETVRAQDMAGLRWFLDHSGDIRRLYQVPDAGSAQQTAWILLDPTLRVMAHAGAERTAEMIGLLHRLPPVEAHAGVPVHAPVLVLPRVFEPELCARLVALYDSQPAELTGVMQDVEGQTVAVLDPHKTRRDVTVTDPELTGLLRARLEGRLFPEIAKAFQFKATRIERYIVSCYDAADGGIFHPHRDNVNLGTAYRRFACSINLNGGFEGGDLRFPEFGRQTLRPPPGGAVVFSCSLIHEVTPLKSGRRYAFLPFIHDEAAQAVLDEYRRSRATAVA